MPPTSAAGDSSRPKALIAMSGGVDSSAAAALMCDAGYSCTGVTLVLYGNNETEINDAREAALRLGMTHNTLDFRDAFRDRVILPFIGTYEKGATPNPCIECNRHIKFGLLFDTLKESGRGFLVTGHYARIQKSGGRWLLKKAADVKKDQSYVLFSLGQETLARTRFPLGELTKAETREIARKRGLPGAAGRESQDICFVPDGDYPGFMERYTGRRYPPGDILDIDGNILGRHRGLVRYTLGQRRGLGVAANEPVYVRAKNRERNTVTLGPESSLYSKSLTINKINLIAAERLEKPVKLMVKTRYLQREHSAWVAQTGEDEIRVTFDEAQRALTPGQAAVLYDGDIVAGGGIILSAGGNG